MGDAGVDVAAAVDWPATARLGLPMPPRDAATGAPLGNLHTGPNYKARCVFKAACKPGVQHQQLKSLRAAARRPWLLASCPVCFPRAGRQGPRAGLKERKAHKLLQQEATAASSGTVRVEWAAWARGSPVASAVVSDMVVWVAWSSPNSPGLHLRQVADWHVEGPSHWAECGCTPCVAAATRAGHPPQQPAGHATAKPKWGAMSHGRHYLGAQRAVDVARDRVSAAENTWVLRLDTRDEEQWPAAMRDSLRAMRTALEAAVNEVAPGAFPPASPSQERLRVTASCKVEDWAGVLGGGPPLHYLKL
jgi:hypothetical protein